MGFFIKDYIDNKYNIPEELLDYFEELNKRAQDLELDLADNYNSAYEMLTYFKQYRISE